MTHISFQHEAGSGLSDDELPGYTAMLEAYHRARAPELRAILDMLPLTQNDSVLDLACGDGWYSIEFACRVHEVVAVDLSPAYLDLARRNAVTAQQTERIRFEQANAEALPFADNMFDLTWCAQSFYSLPDPLAALREMARVTRPGGCVAVLENDTLHHLLLPWPAELELAVRQAQLQALAVRSAEQGTDKFYIGRNLCGVFRRVGIEPCEIRAIPVERSAPLSADEELFLQFHFADLRECVWPYLDKPTREAFDMLFDEESPLYLLRQPDFRMTHLESLAIGTMKG
jgi:SAM-dependent methyltransferase